MQHTWCFTPLHALAKMFWSAILVNTAVQSSAIQGSSQHPFNQEASAKDPGQHFRAKQGHLWHKTGVELHSWGPGCPCCRCSPSSKSHLPFCPPKHRAPPNHGCCFRHPAEPDFQQVFLSSPQLRCFSCSHSLGHSWCEWKDKGIWTWLLLSTD